MSTYIPAALRRRVRARFVDRCAYCLTAEVLIAAIFEIEHVIPRSAGGETVFEIYAWPVLPVIAIKPIVK